MKRLFLSLCLILFLSMFFKISAIKNLKINILPNNSLYKVDRFFENISLKIRNGEADKIKALCKYSNERITEINSLPKDDIQLYVNDTYKDYGSNIKKAYLYLAKIKINNENDKQISTLKEIIKQSEDKKNQIKQLALKYISDDIQTQVNQSINSSKLFLYQDSTELDLNKNQLLKLNAISEVSNLSISEILNIENSFTINNDNNNNKIQINYHDIYESLGLNEVQIENKLHYYLNNLKDIMNEKLNNTKNIIIEKIKDKVIKEIDNL